MNMASNISGNAYALTILSPIKDGFTEDEVSFADYVRDLLQGWNSEANSPMALVPQTYLCRYFVLDDVYLESLPGASALDTLIDWLPIVPDSLRPCYWPNEDHLKSRYLVFSCNCHCGPTGDLDGYLRGMWHAISDRIKEIWGYCYGFEQVDDADKFIAYMKKCQFTATLFFVGSNDDPLEEQLKALYLKQEFSKFAVANQGLDAATLRKNFKAFIQEVAPTNLTAPTWSAGGYRLDQLVKRG
jgi:hypothetical protein